MSILLSEKDILALDLKEALALCEKAGIGVKLVETNYPKDELAKNDVSEPKMIVVRFRFLEEDNKAELTTVGY